MLSSSHVKVQQLMQANVPQEPQEFSEQAFRRLVAPCVTLSTFG
jgi:hypothetical protein